MVRPYLNELNLNGQIIYTVSDINTAVAVKHREHGVEQLSGR